MIQTHRILLLACFLVATGISVAHSNDRSATMQEHVQFLSSEELAGRKPGTAGFDKAAEYVAKHFEEVGVETVPGADDYYQPFSVETSVSAGENNTLDFHVLVVRRGLPKEQGKVFTRSWTAGEDFTPLAFSDIATVENLPIVYCGYGISAEEVGYDDYSDIDVKGKVAVILRGSPLHNNFHGPHDEKIWSDTSQLLNHISLRNKTTNAREKGAAAVLFVTPLGDSANVLMPLSMSDRGHNTGIPVMHVNRSSLAKIFPRNKSLKLLEDQIRKTMSPKSFELEDTKVSLSTDVSYEQAQTHNIIGWIPGTDASLKEEWIVVGAHVDHLGMGGAGSLHDSDEPTIHPGADDNASGTAVMMEIAADIAENPLKRPVLFMGFSAEEMGLLGSAHYVKNALIPLEKTVFMLNLDMVGRKEDGELNVTGTGSSDSWAQLLDSMENTFANVTARSKDGVGRSDHSSFYLEEVPVLFFFTGLHADYHRPTDTWEKINYKGMDTVRMMSHFVLNHVGNLDTPPKYTKVASDPHSGGMRAQSRWKVSVGTIPDYSDNPDGMRITGVRPGSPAEKGGMQGGDVIVKFGNTTVKNIYDYMHALQGLSPGEEVECVVLREPRGEKVTLTIKVVAR